MGDYPTLAQARKVLVVEGYSDLRFYAEMMEQIGLPSDVHIKQFNGRVDIETKLEEFVTSQLLSQKERLAVIVDANGDGPAAAGRFAALLSRLTGQSVECGRWTAGTPRVGLFIVPGPGEAGEIETLVWRSWSASDGNREAVACIESYLVCMRGRGIEPQSPEKGRIGALLALRNDDDPRLGPGAQARVFDFGRPEFGRLATFLRGFGSDGA
jgi:hypothetical protein